MSWQFHEDIGKKLTDAMRAVANANDELRGVFTVDWNQPAPDASGKKLIPNEVVHALIQHSSLGRAGRANARFWERHRQWKVLAERALYSRIEAQSANLTSAPICPSSRWSKSVCVDGNHGVRSSL
jgi:hypothetical protein